MTTQEFIQQLHNMSPVSFNSETNKVQMSNGMEVYHRIELAEYTKATLPLQMQLAVSYKGAYVMRWGAETEEDNKALVDCWVRLKNRAYNVERALHDMNSHEGYNLFMEGLK
jgi:hypothetical protein